MRPLPGSGEITDTVNPADSKIAGRICSGRGGTSFDHWPFRNLAV